MDPETHDVIVVGAGPVGLMTARLLGMAGHDVRVLERWPEPYPMPRAVHFDHEIGRLFQSASLADEVRAISERVPDQYEWRNRDGESLVKIDWSVDGPCGWPIANFFSQPELEQVLAKAVEEMPNVTLSRGMEVVELTEHPDHVQVSVTGRTLKHKTLRARYVIGCDGANSFVRQHMSTSLTDLGFYFDWLIVDTIPTDEREWSPMNWQLCDPARPTTMVSGGPGRRRWEFMRVPGDDLAQLNTPEMAWKLLETWGRTPENTKLERHAVYTFQARWADSWNQGRLLLAGDAAHLMPPFAGQGMCSGIRDAANLSWKLDLVLRGITDEALLDSYTSERSAHLQHAISMSVALGRTICVLDPQEATERDERMIAAGADPRTALPPMPPEQLGAGAWDQTITPAALQGTLSPQLSVTDGDRSGLFDDVVGAGFTLIGYGIDPTDSLSAAQKDVLYRLGVTVVTVLEEEYATVSLDPASTRRVVAVGKTAHALFADNGAIAMLVRPDFYVYGAATNDTEIGVLVDELAQQAHLTPASTP
ncbi:MAG: bifunctional 3-(3-hydroxy-phenyl)propionate/3-hydroxycinnamic acid hydroxylase [Nocardioides sp.]